MSLNQFVPVLLVSSLKLVYRKKTQLLRVNVKAKLRRRDCLSTLLYSRRPIFLRFYHNFLGNAISANFFLADCRQNFTAVK